MEKERINILIGSDINYAPYYGVMLTSLFMNNTESQFDVYLLTDNSWTEHETHKFENLCRKYHSRFFVNVVNIDLIKNFPTIPHISLPTYYRLQAANILPASVDKLLYLDGDMIVNGDIRSLWNTDLNGVAFAGVDDCASWEDSYFTRIGLDRKYGYFNAGVSLYNLAYWRENDLSSKLIQHIIDNPDKVPLMDQDAVNFLLKDKKKRFPVKYNLQTWAFLRANWDNYDEAKREEYRQATKAPIIIHYSGWYKPWTIRSYYGLPFFNLWIKYWKVSAWRNAVQYKPLFKYVKFIVKYISKIRLFDTRNKLFVEESYGLA